MHTRKLLAAGVLLLSQAACMKTQSVNPPVPYIESRSPDLVWITTSSGTQSMVYRPKVMEDSIFGFDQAGQQVTLPVGLVQAAQVRTLDRQKTFLAGAGLVGVAGTAVYILAKNAASKGVKTCEGSPGNAVCEGKHNGSEGIGRQSNGGVAIPINTGKVLNGLAKALFGN